jgi:hypothetical protein
MTSNTSKDKTVPFAVDPEIDAIGKVLAALEPLDSAGRDRVAKWISAKLGMSSFGVGSKSPAADNKAGNVNLTTSAHEGVEDGISNAPKVVLWMKQNDLTEEALSEVFHVAGEQTAVLASEMPGKTDSERAMNAYLLTGAASFLASGSPTFADKVARELCSTTGCYDHTNHSKRIKGKELMGSKDKGWTLTGPGLKKAANLIKHIGASGE